MILCHNYWMNVLILKRNIKTKQTTKQKIKIRILNLQLKCQIQFKRKRKLSQNKFSTYCFTIFLQHFCFPNLWNLFENPFVCLMRKIQNNIINYITFPSFEMSHDLFSFHSEQCCHHINIISPNCIFSPKQIIYRYKQFQLLLTFYS